MSRTTEQWVDLLKSRCKSEGVECQLSDSDLWGWVTAGVNADDSEDDVFAALCETFEQANKAFHAVKQEEWTKLTQEEVEFPKAETDE